MRLGNMSVPGDCERISPILSRVGDKWTVLVILILAEQPKRFNQIRREVENISQRMLTMTLRGLEQDGLVARKVYADKNPPWVEYRLTALGQTLVARFANGLRKTARPSNAMPQKPQPDRTPLAVRQVIGRNIARHTGRIRQCHAAPALAQLGHAVLPDQFGSVGQAHDDVERKARSSAEFEQVVRACAGHDRGAMRASRNYEQGCDAKGDCSAHDVTSAWGIARPVSHPHRRG